MTNTAHTITSTNGTTHAIHTTQHTFARVVREAKWHAATKGRTMIVREVARKDVWDAWENGHHTAFAKAIVTPEGTVY